MEAPRKVLEVVDKKKLDELKRVAKQRRQELRRLVEGLGLLVRPGMCG